MEITKEDAGRRDRLRNGEKESELEEPIPSSSSVSIHSLCFSHNDVDVCMSNGSDSFIAATDSLEELTFRTLKELCDFRDTLNIMMDKGLKILEEK